MTGLTASEADTLLDQVALRALDGDKRLFLELCDMVDITIKHRAKDEPRRNATYLRWLSTFARLC